MFFTLFFYLFLHIENKNQYDIINVDSCTYAADFLLDEKKNVLDETTLKQSILRGTLSSPFNKRPLRTKDLVVISNKKVPGELNFVVSDNLTCLGSFDGGIFSEPVNIMLSVLTKHKKENPELTEKINGALSALKEEGVIATIFEKYDLAYDAE